MAINRIFICICEKGNTGSILALVLSNHLNVLLPVLLGLLLPTEDAPFAFWNTCGNKDNDEELNVTQKSTSVLWCLSFASQCSRSDSK